MDVYRNDQTEARWKGHRADVVWLIMFDESCKPLDIVAIEGMDHYLGKAEWFDLELDDEFTPTEMRGSDEEIDNIRISWSNEFEDNDSFD